MVNLDKLPVDELLFYAIATSIIAKAEISANGLDGKERIGIYLDSDVYKRQVYILLDTQENMAMIEKIILSY